MNFLKPTKQKIIATIIILIALLIANLICEAVAEFLIPKELLTGLLQQGINQTLNQGGDALMAVGAKMMISNIVINIIIIYLGVCLIFKVNKIKSS